MHNETQIILFKKELKTKHTNKQTNKQNKKNVFKVLNLHANTFDDGGEYPSQSQSYKVTCIAIAPSAMLRIISTQPGHIDALHHLTFGQRACCIITL